MEIPQETAFVVTERPWNPLPGSPPPPSPTVWEAVDPVTGEYGAGTTEEGAIANLRICLARKERISNGEPDMGEAHAALVVIHGQAIVASCLPPRDATSMFTAMSIPGSIVGEGITQVASINVMKRLIDSAMRATGSPEQWLAAAWARADARGTLYREKWNQAYGVDA